MYNWEKKLIGQINKHMIEIAFLLISVLALLIRRNGIWHVIYDYETSFNPEAAGYYHTPFYGLVIWLVSFIPMTPIRTMKYLILGFDFLVAVAGTVLLRKNNLCKSKQEALVCYSLMLVTPLSIEYGIVWIHPDSICFALILITLILLQNKRYVPAGCVSGLACALQIQYLVALLGIGVFLACRKRNHYTKVFHFLSAFLGVVFFLTLAGSRYSHVGLSDSLSMLFAGLLPDLAILKNYGYLLGMSGILYGFYKPRTWWLMTGIHVGIIIYIAQVLQQNF